MVARLASLGAALLAISVGPVATLARVDEYRLEKIAPERAGPDATPQTPAQAPALPPPLPKEIPEPFAKLLDHGGLRLIAVAPKPAAGAPPATAPAAEKDKLLCELWLRSELPLAEKPATELGVKQTKLPPGSFVGVMRTFGATSDYRDQPIDAGIYALRYFHQPSDGDHLGTSDSRDFLILTGFEQDKDPAAVADKEALVALATPISSSGHALVLYVALPPDEAHEADETLAAGDAPRLYQRADVHEWAAELELTGKSPGAAATEKLRLGLVLVGHTAH